MGWHGGGLASFMLSYTSNYFKVMSEVANSRDDAAFLEPPVSFEFEATEQQAQKRRKLFAAASPDHRSAAMELVESTWEKQRALIPSEMQGALPKELTEKWKVKFFDFLEEAMEASTRAEASMTTRLAQGSAAKREEQSSSQSTELSLIHI